MNRILAACVAVLALGAPAHAGPPITLESLLSEMVDRDAAARYPDPPYTCRQASSYDRASTDPASVATWFANGDANQYIRVEEIGGRKDRVMMDADGPGAVVRIWSANPKGTLRVYLDGAAAPAIEAPMTDLLDGKWKVGAPLSAQRARGWNLYLPIPYARHCKITSDADGFYYQVNYRTYPAGTAVESFSMKAMAAGASQLDRVQQLLSRGAEPPVTERSPPLTLSGTLGAGEAKSIDFKGGAGGGAVRWLVVSARGPDLEQAMRQTVLEAQFDGEDTVWCPVGDFLGSGVGANEYRDWWKAASATGGGLCVWPMPFRTSGRFTLRNTGDTPVEVALSCAVRDWAWDDRSMHFHATWRHEFPMHVAGARGTSDWNYVEIKGKGVYMGDTLAVMNPVPEWWGEGDEKIYVDGEKFPSHFGTGTEDYYGYAWCCPEKFSGPFHSQPRSDGQAHGNNWGHTTVSRVRLLDGIPFATGLKFDMEAWHWRECNVGYAATTYFYAVPGATTNREPSPRVSGGAVPRPPPLPPPFKVDGAVECEDLKVRGASAGLPVVRQDMRGFAARTWSGEAHLWVQGRKAGDFVELFVPVASPAPRPMALTMYATKSWDYGIIRFSVNGQPAGEDVDCFSGREGACAPTGPIKLGVFTPANGGFIVRAEVVGGNENAKGTRSFFGLDCLVLEPAPEPGS